MGTGTVALRIVSACKTAEQFVSTFARYCDQTSLYIATASPKPPGTQVRFSLTLAGGNPVMSGLGRVVESHSGSAHRFGRPGMRIRFDELDEMSRNWVRVLTAQSGKPRTTGQIAAAAPPPADGAAAAPAAPAEERTPGSPVVLPANPLSRMDDESIELLVDCSLYEVTEDELRAITFDEDTDVVSPMAFLAAAGNAATEPLVASKVVPRPPILPDDREFSRDSSRTIPGNAPVKVATASALPPLPRPVPLATSPHHETRKGIPVAEIVNIPTDEVEPLPPPVPRAAGPAVYPLPPASSPVPDVDELLRRPRQFSVQVMVAVGVASAAIGVALGYAIPRGRTEARATPPDAPVAAPVAASETETASREPTPAPAARAAKPEPRPKPASTSAPDLEPAEPAPAADACTLDISTRPDPVAISIDGQSIGDSPLVHTIPCGQRAVVKFQRPRYQSVEKVVKLAPGDRRRLSVTMERPKVSLRVDTTPRGATVKVDGRRIGSGPATTQVLGFTSVKIEVAKDGYKTARRSVKPGGKPERVSIKLEREATASPAKKRRR